MNFLNDGELSGYTMWRRASRVSLWVLLGDTKWKGWRVGPTIQRHRANLRWRRTWGKLRGLGSGNRKPQPTHCHTNGLREPSLDQVEGCLNGLKPQRSTPFVQRKPGAREPCLMLMHGLFEPSPSDSQIKRNILIGQGLCDCRRGPTCQFCLSLFAALIEPRKRGEFACSKGDHMDCSKSWLHGSEEFPIEWRKKREAVGREGKQNWLTPFPAPWQAQTKS